MGTRKKRERQEPFWYGSELPVAPGHPFYSRLNEVLDQAGFDRFCEEHCGLLTRQVGTSVVGPRPVFSHHDDRLLRGTRQRAGHRLALGRFADPAAVSLYRTGREYAQPCDDFAYQAADRWRNSSADLHPDDRR